MSRDPSAAIHVPTTIDASNRGSLEARSPPPPRLRRNLSPTQWGMISFPGLGGGVFQHADRGLPDLPGTRHSRPDTGECSRCRWSWARRSACCRAA